MSGWVMLFAMLPAVFAVLVAVLYVLVNPGNPEPPMSAAECSLLRERDLLAFERAAYVEAELVTRELACLFAHIDQVRESSSEVEPR